MTNLMGVDLATFRFDFDLTFAALLMHPDGTVYHRYGGRSPDSALASLSMDSFVRLLKEGLATHKAYAKSPSPPRIARRTLDDIPAWAAKVEERKRAGRPLSCYHCHFVYDAELHQGRRDGTWQRSKIWRWPPPARVGLGLDGDVQNQVTSVALGSAAQRAGLRAGDVLRELAGQRLLTHMDLSWVLERTAAKGATLPLTYQREGTTAQATLTLGPGWRTGTPRQFSWRPSKWQLRPRPGFGGPTLSKAERRSLNINGDLAFKVGYLVTWGDEPHYGRAARKAGIRKGDVVVRVGEAALRTPSEFHSWWRLTRKPGETVEIDVLRNGKLTTLTLTVISPPK